MASQYDGFISYSHAADGKLAPALQRALQLFAKPWYRLRALHIFRDETSLSANPALWPSIEAALSKSRWFIYLASPAAAQSPWVAREVDWWLSHRDATSLLIVLTEGAIQWDDGNHDFDWTVTNCIARDLAGRFNNEPLWVDLSWSHRIDNLNLRHSQFRSAVLRVAAPLHARAPDELDGEDVRQFHHTRRIALGAVTALVLLTIASLLSAYLAVQRSRESSSRELAMYSVQEIPTDPELSLRLALHAVERAPTEQAEAALRRALGESKVRQTLYTSTQVSTAAFSPDGATLAIGSGREVGLFSRAPFRALAQPAEVRSARFSRDSRLLATGGADGKARVWEVASGKLLCEMQTTGEDVIWLELSPDAALLVSVGFSLTAGAGPLQIWSTRSCKLLSELKGQTGAIGAVAFDSTSQKIVTGNWDGSAQLWDASTGTSLRTFVGHRDVVEAVAFSEDDSQIFTASADTTVRAWDVATGKATAAGGDAIDRTTRGAIGHHLAAVHPTGIAFASDGTRATLYDARSGRKLRELTDFPSSCTSAFFSADHHLLGCPGTDGSAFVWEVATGIRIAEFHGHKGELNDAAFSPDGRSLLSAGTDNTARVWAIEDGGRDLILQGHTGEVTGAEWSSDGKLVATASVDGTARVWSADTGARVSVSPGPGRVAAISFAEDGNRLLIARNHASSLVWDARAGHATASFEFDAEFDPSDANWSADGSIALLGIRKFLFSAQNDPSMPPTPPTESTFEGRLLRWDVRSAQTSSWIDAPRGHVFSLMCGYSRKAGVACLGTPSEQMSRLWDIRTGKVIAEIRDHLPSPSVGALSNDGRLLALSNGKGVEIWETQPARLKWQLPVTRGFFATSLEFDASASRLLTGGGQADPVPRIWDVSSGRQLAELRGHTHATTSAHFSPDGKLIVTASQDNTVRVWDAASGRTLIELRGHRGMVFGARFSPDGRKVLSASSDGTARIYDISLAKPLDELVRIAGERETRQLTPQEERQYHL